MSKVLANSVGVAQIDKRPCFSIPARPLSVDVGILDLEPDTEILISTSLAGLSGITACKAKVAIEEIERTIKRQAKGHYTMVEAAEIIAEAYGFDASDFLKTRMQPAFESGALKLLDPKDGGLVMARQCKKHYDWVTPANLNKWLETEFEYRWPVAVLVVAVGASSGVKADKAEQTPNRETGPRFHMTKSALIAAHKYEWTTIEGDISNASDNGLDAAKAGARGWWELEAMEWARSKGKLLSAVKGVAELAQTMNSMASLPGRKYKQGD